MQQTLRTKSTADGAASTTTNETTPLLYATTASGLVLTDILVKESSGATLTASNTNYATLRVIIYDASHNVLSTLDLTTKTSGASAGTGNWAAWSHFSWALNNVFPITMAQGATLTFQITKTGTGVAVPICTIFFSFTEIP